ncbi:hypothetical protein SAMN05216332_101154 [Nitrosospira briensis]|nr:hypothetical protein SAMN05216332_101154 [Nitrosospira briensis]
MLDECIVHGFGYLGSRITSLIEGTRKVQQDWKPVVGLPFRVSAIVERDSVRLAHARNAHPGIPCFSDLEEAIRTVGHSSTFIKDFTSPLGRRRLLEIAGRSGIPVLLEKPLSSPGVKVSLAGREREASVSMSEAFNPVVNALAAKLFADRLQVETLAFVRVNSLTLQRLQDPGYRRDIIGGAFVDKLIHDLHLLTSGTIIGPAKLEFGIPHVNEIVLDILVSQCRRSLTFSSLGGDPLGAYEASLSSARPAEMLVDLSIPVCMDGRPVPTRWIASWGGVPKDLAQRLGILDTDVAAAQLVSGGNANAALPGSLFHNLKLIVCGCRRPGGEEIQLICNLQARGTVKAWLIERSNSEERHLPVRFCVPIIESIIAFSQSFRGGGYLDIHDIIHADRVALQLRSEFRAPSGAELDPERSLAILHHNHGLRHAVTLL